VLRLESVPCNENESEIKMIEENVQTLVETPQVNLEVAVHKPKP